VCDVALRIPGRHNVLNALAAAALAWHNGADGGQIARGLARFWGLRRRLEDLGVLGGVACLDDYAHHPTEVAASLATVRQMFPGRNVWVVFQPHQASRTARLLDELAESLENADVLLVAEVFRAREGPYRRGEVTAADLADRARHSVVTVPALHGTGEITRYLHDRLAPGDVLVTMGAGDIRKVFDGLAIRTGKDRAAG
jgi:UDP-N-acetylmuramate--alanine ligase